jgi:hypothetical protein
MGELVNDPESMKAFEDFLIGEMLPGSKTTAASDPREHEPYYHNTINTFRPRKPITR